MLRVLMVASEATPFAKTGGLADVVGSLPRALRVHGVRAAVLLPRYHNVELKNARLVYPSLPVWLGSHRYDTSVYQAGDDPAFYLLDCPPLYDRSGLYGGATGDYPDNHIRFAVLARGALEICRYLFRPDVIHCHDWQAGLVPVYLRSLFSVDPTFMGIRTLFTIHNLGYHGLFPPAVLPLIGLDGTVFHPAGLEFFGKVSYIKGGLAYGDALNTVSPTYAREIQTPKYGFGLDGLLRARSSVLTGILNGVDYTQWNPETDTLIAANYSADDLSGKSVCKRDLIAEFGLPEEALSKPLIGIVSRFTSQKGADLIAEIGAELALEDLHLVALGAGESKYEELFLALARDYPRSIAVRIGYDNALAHKIEAGADLFLMPSRYEPCGLNQIYSLRYGTAPIVRATGGLDDTIEEGTGFKFSDYSGQALLGAIRDACAAFADRERWFAMIRRGMAKDFSWEASAARYASLYRRLGSMV